MLGSIATAIAVNPDQNTIKELKFRKLYESDKEFRKNIDLIREITLKEKLSKEDWEKLYSLFKAVFEKLEVELSDKDFEILKQIIEEERPKIRAYVYYKQRESLSTQASSSIASDYLPRLYQPTSDLNNGNGLIKTYAKVFDENIYGYHLSGKYIIEVTYVFADEDHPDWDWLYDWVRLTYWDRIQDIETFFLVVDKSDEEVDRLSFIGLELQRYNYLWYSISPIYSGTATWEEAAHEREKIYSFNTYGDHPIVYVNTWNHAMGEDDNNPSMADSSFNTWQNYVEGSRMDAENDYTTTIIYINEKIGECP
jgi:hypothetical protein